jgi:hypothetical protein
MTPSALRLRDAAGLTGAAILLTAYFTWPLALRPGSLARIDSGDGQFAVWNVAWVAHAILSPDAHVFDANIFHPNRRTLAYSEANLGAGILAVPGYWLTRNPYVAHNTAVLISMSVAVAGMYLLAFRLTRSRAGALLAGILFAFCPFVFAHTAHVQLLMLGPMPFVLLALHALADRPAWPRALLLGLALGVQALFCAYWGVLAGLLVAVGVLFFAVSRGLWRRPLWWALAATAAVVAIVAVLPFFLPYLDVQKEGFGRPLDEARVYSSTWRDYLASSAWLHTWMLPHLKRWGGWVEVLFPGFISLALAAAGMASAFRRTASPDDSAPETRETVMLYSTIALLALWASFGPRAGLYSLLYQAVPVFSFLRAPARFGLAVVLALSILSAVGMAAVLARTPRRWQPWAAAAILGFAIVELSMTMPFRAVPEWTRAHQALARSRPGAVVEFPFYYREGEFFRHARYMLTSTVHWQPLINGYSDHLPPDFKQQAPVLATFPSPEAFDILRARRARYVVFHPGLYTARQRAALVTRLGAYHESLQSVVQDEHAWLFEIVSWPDQHPDLSDEAAKAP